MWHDWSSTFEVWLTVTATFAPKVQHIPVLKWQKNDIETPPKKFDPDLCRYGFAGQFTWITSSVKASTQCLW